MTLLRRTILVAAMFCLALSVIAQDIPGAGAVTTANDGSVTIDASRLTSVVELKAPLRFAPRDDPKYAEPGFDDSKWPLINPGMDRRLADTHTPNVQDGSDWSRLHVHLLNANGPLGIRISTRNGIPLEVFANGQLAGVIRGFPSGVPYLNHPSVIRIPAAKEIVLAIHCFSGKGEVRHFSPIQSVELTGYDLLDKMNQLDYLTLFASGFLLDVAISCVFFACVPFAVVLFIAQRDHREYLWLAILCLMICMDYMSRVSIYAGWLPAFEWLVIIRNLFTVLVRISCLEFVADLASLTRRNWLRVLQGFFILHYLVFNISALTGNWFTFGADWSYLIGAACVVIAVMLMLWYAFRRGSKECGIFLLPILLLPLSELSGAIASVFPQFRWAQWYGGIGVLGFTAYQLGSLPLLAGLIGIVLYRFIRVSKDEEIAAAELEAAKTVQQLLIPEMQPATPGFIVESAYIPARQVGGDFFLVMPGPEASGDASLLAVMGDVSGKGLQAAMVVSTIIGGLRMGFVRQPAEVLKYLNRMLEGHISGFATCCAVLIEPDGRMVIANAGNPAPYTKGAEITTLPGLPLGMVAGIAYEETSFTLGRGERLTFVSDGVVEAIKPSTKELFGFDRTLRVSGESAAVIAKAACDFGIGAPQADDITVLTVSLE